MNTPKTKQMKPTHNDTTRAQEKTIKNFQCMRIVVSGL